ncbi:MAG: alpha-hydroxy-acid oxidizing protein [Chloroflexi bacterium]|nr:alpha-hydroxy-acid oxidizing protein [Chloroflexota bacterium]
MTRILSLTDFAGLAERTMDRPSFDYIAGGSGEEITLRENVEALRRRRLRSRILVDVTSVDPSTHILGAPLRMPVGIAPMAFGHLAHPSAEPAMARAAGQAGVAFCLSTMSSTPLEEVAGAAPDGAPRWFQLYVHRDRAVSHDLVSRAEAAGYSAIVLTADLPVAGDRERDLRNGLQYPERFGNFTAAEGVAGRPLLEVIGGFNERGLTWRDVAWLRGLTSLPIVIKGVMSGADASRAVRAGAAGVWVSNHGGRQLDRAPASIDVLDEVVRAVGQRTVDGQPVEIYLDGGVRRGADVATALAMGAQAVFVGRPLGLALAVGGEAGVRRGLELLRGELLTTMALMGVTSVDRFRRWMVEP